MSDVGYVSFHGLAMSLPEIYYRRLANQWTVVRKLWNARRRLLLRRCDGVDRRRTDPGSGVEHLNSLNSGLVDSEIACFGC